MLFFQNYYCIIWRLIFGPLSDQLLDGYDKKILKSLITSLVAKRWHSNIVNILQYHASTKNLEYLKIIPKW